MPNNTVIYIFNSLIRLSILFFILYLIFTNFGTFLMILGIIIILISFFVYNFKKKMRANTITIIIREARVEIPAPSSPISGMPNFP